MFVTHRHRYTRIFGSAKVKVKRPEVEKRHAKYDERDYESNIQKSRNWGAHTIRAAYKRSLTGKMDLLSSYTKSLGVRYPARRSWYALGTAVLWLVISHTLTLIKRKYDHTECDSIKILWHYIW